MLIILIGKKSTGKHTIMSELIEKHRYLPFTSQSDDEIKNNKYVVVMDPNEAQRIISNRNKSNITIAYISISEYIRKKRALRKEPELRNIWDSLTDIENKNFSREFIVDMTDIVVYNNNKLQDTVSTLLYKISRY